MKTNRRKFSADEKVKIIRKHLIEKTPISEVCDQHGIKPTQFYQWQKVFFENGAAAFGKSPNKRNGIRSNKLEQKVSRLESKLANKDEVIAEIMADHVRLKKNLGED